MANKEGIEIIQSSRGRIYCATYAGYTIKRKAGHMGDRPYFIKTGRGSTGRVLRTSADNMRMFSTVQKAIDAIDKL